MIEFGGGNEGGFGSFVRQQMPMIVGYFGHELVADLSNFLMTVHRLQDLLDGEPEKLDVARRLLRRMLESADNARETAVTFKRFGIPPKDVPREVDLMSVIHKARNLCSYQAHEHGVGILIERFDASPIGFCDPHWLLLSLVAILRNAIESYSSRELDVGQGKVTLLPAFDGKTFTLQVLDNGVGIKRAHLSRAFNRGFTTKPGALGMGLYVAQCVIQQLHGAIDIHSSPKKGTTVTVRIPASARRDLGERSREIMAVHKGGLGSAHTYSDERPSGTSNVLAEVEEAGRRVLLVDDNYDFSMSCASYLREAGYNVFTAYSAIDAMKLVMETTTPFDIAIIDVCLPTSHETDTLQVEGFNLARNLKERSPATRLIGMSGIVPSDNVKSLSAHFDAYLDKPLTPDSLIAAVGDLINPGRRKPVVFIVHGHDDVAKLALKNYIQNTLGLGEPLILHEQASQGRTIIEKFEQTSKNVDVVFVILTPDDAAGKASDPDRAKRRARQNVIFELGFFLGKLQRTSARVILLHKGDIELPSDMAGLIYIDISAGIEAAGEEIRRELNQWL